MDTTLAAANGNSTTAFFLASYLKLQAEHDAGLQHWASYGYADQSLQRTLIERGLAKTRELINKTLMVIRCDGAMLYAWQGTLALVEWEGGAA